MTNSKTFKCKWLDSFPKHLPNAYDDIPHFSKDYFDAIREISSLVVRNGAVINDDYMSQYINVANGARHTSGNPAAYKHTIYLLGPCYAYGVYSEDSQTVASHLQYLCNKHEPDVYAVKNYGFGGGSLEYYALNLAMLDLKEGDVVLLLSHFRRQPEQKVRPWQFIANINKMCMDKGADFCFFGYPSVARVLNPTDVERDLKCCTHQELFEGKKALPTSTEVKVYAPHDEFGILTALGCRNIDLQPYIDRPHDHGEIFVEGGHMAGKGYKILAAAMYQTFIRNIALSRKPLNHHAVMAASYDVLARFIRNRLASNATIKNWLAEVKNNCFSGNGTIGAIVMNCNPFTLGHLYLIEKALNDVDFLYIFIVEENLSDFDFKDRMLMVKQGTEHLGDRIKVLPGGQFIISSVTFPEYFNKQQIKVEKVDSTNDISIFGAIIASALNITTRFIGEEPYCNVTNQYNQTMKNILPYMGVKIKEIPRKASEGHFISASLVRQHLQNNDFEALGKIVPKTTYEFLAQNYAENPVGR